MTNLCSQIASQWLQAGLHVCAPALCHSCDKLLDYDETWLCNGCRECFLPPNDPKCMRCNARIGPHLDTSDGCLLCKHDYFYFERVVTLGFYQSQFKDVILRIKHLQGEQLARTLGTLLGEHFSRTQSFSPDFITCIPVHWWKRLTRGHNQTEAIATGVADILKKPFLNSVLRKIRHTPEQSGLLPTERRKNLRHAFSPVSQPLIQGKKILLVDDVLTTGTTANQAAKILISAGADTVVVAVLARSFGR
jgi:ComF family protein